MASSTDQTLSQLSSVDAMHGVGGVELNTVQILDDDCIDGMEAYCLATSNAEDEGPIQIYRNNDVDFMMEERLDDDEPVDDIYDELDGDVKHSIICDTIDNGIYLENVCRLCADTMANDADMFDLFTVLLEHSLEQINKLLPKQIHADDTTLPQRICSDCFNKLATLSQTLGLFAAAQERFQQ